MFDTLLGIEGPESKLFDIVIQLGAILAVCWVYRDRLVHAVVNLGPMPGAHRFVVNIIVAFLPAAVAGVLLHAIKGYLFSPWVVAVSLIVGGLVILLIERIRPRPRIHDVEGMRVRTALAVGFCQVLAMIPGVSRAGATIMGAMMLQSTGRRRPSSRSSWRSRQCSARRCMTSTRTARSCRSTAAC